MSSEVSEVLNALGEKFGLFVDWSQQNAQPYIEDLMQRVVQYRIVSHICWLVFMILLMIVSAILISRFIKMNNNNKITFENCVEEGSLFFISIICLIFGFIASISKIGSIIECYYMPEMVFIEELKTLLK